MKKVLLTTTALVMTAGVAAADITFSGAGEVGMNDGTLYTGYDFNVALSAAADNGMTFAMGFDMGAGEIADIADKETDTQSGTIGASGVTIGYDGYTVVVNPGDVDNIYDDGNDHHDISFAGSFGGISATIAMDQEGGDSSYTLGYSAGDVSLTMTGTNDDSAAGNNASKIVLGYAMGDLSAKVTANDNGSDADTTELSLTYAVTDALSVTGAMDNADGYDMSIAYSAGAASANYSTDENDAWEADVSYDMGGATAFYATDSNSANIVGVKFSF